MTAHWVDVFEGPSWKAGIIKGELELAGIPAFVPDENTQTMYPFFMGGRVFDLRVLVPEDRVADARAIVATAHDAPITARSEDETKRERVERMGRAIRWLAILAVTAPIALVLAFPYFVSAASMRPKPAGHALTILATLLSAAWLMPVIAFLLPGQPWPF